MSLDQLQSITNDAIYWRGLFIQRYAGIEFALSHLLVMASYNSRYKALGPLPYRQSAKLKRLTALLKMEGPLLKHKKPLETHISYFMGIEEDRHFIAHGLMALRMINGSPICHFRMYQHLDGEIAAGVWDLPVSDLQGLAEAIEPHSRRFPSLVADIGEDHLIGR